MQSSMLPTRLFWTALAGWCKHQEQELLESCYRTFLTGNTSQRSVQINFMQEFQDVLYKISADVNLLKYKLSTNQGRFVK